MIAKRFLQTLSGEILDRPPFWFMRQAGRYLPEYLETRAKCGGFLDLCFTPEKAAEVTLQPINRFDMDAAILFSDILVIPLALGQEVGFVKGEGPKLPPITSSGEIEALRYNPEKLFPIYGTLGILSKELPKDKTLIGFSGSPWTLACYMIEGGGSKDFAKARKFGHLQSAAFSQLLAKLEYAIIDYCSRQIIAGAEVIQLFDSWSGVCSEQEFDDWVVAPTKRIVAALKAKHPTIPIIGFPRLAGTGYRRYVKQTGIDGVSIDVQISPAWAKSHLSEFAVVQGNLDPILLATDGDAAIKQAKSLLKAYRDVSFIFNLGHGFIPETPIKNVERLVELLKS
ncbi:MAG: uroporphyrinogen decarboxylase [Rickettsiales bacterium]|nr:uroporphyrinogen decarboxylase [Rickettsiales bacterium]